MLRQATSYLDYLPSDVLIKVGLFAGARGMAAASKAYEKCENVFTPNESTLARNTDAQIEAAEIGALVLSGNEKRLKETLAAAKANGKLEELLKIKTTVTYRKNQTLEDITLLQIAIWSLNEKSYGLIVNAGMTKEQIEAQKIEMTSAVPPKFVRDFGLHADVESVNARFTELNTMASKMNWDTFQAGSDEDLQLQALYKKVIEEQAKLPPSMTHEMLHPAQPFFRQNKLNTFSEKSLLPITKLKSGDSCDPLQPNCEYGEKFGIVRGSGDAKRINITNICDAAKKEKDTSKLSLTEMTALGTAKIAAKRLAWFNKVMQAALELALSDQAKIHTFRA